MEIQSVKIELLKLILNTDNAIILEKVMNIFRNENPDFWNKLSKDEQSDIIEGISELDREAVYGYDEVMKKHRP
jgi:hypothetical protein